MGNLRVNPCQSNHRLASSYLAANLVKGKYSVKDNIPRFIC
jgi:hypothetical protein